MKTSARIQFSGTVVAVRDGAINDEIDLDAGGGVRIVATVTRDSRDALGRRAAQAENLARTRARSRAGVRRLRRRCACLGRAVAAGVR